MKIAMAAKGTSTGGTRGLVLKVDTLGKLHHPMTGKITQHALAKTLVPGVEVTQVASATQ